MDPWLVSSVLVGILAFAVEMTKMASKVKETVEHFRSASHEIDELFQRLVILDTVCKLVEQALGNKQISAAATINSSLLSATESALVQCHRKISQLNKTVSLLGEKPANAKNAFLRSEARQRL